MNEYYWEIETFDGTKIAIPPNAADVVKRRIGNKEPINTTNEVIPANQIKSFHITGRRYSSQPLLEAAAQAFDQPLLTENGDIACKWMKKRVPYRVYLKQYAGIPAYRSLGEEDGMHVVAFRLPVHLINSSVMEECSEIDIKVLTKI